MPSLKRKERMGLYIANMLIGSYTWLFTPLPINLEKELGNHILFSKYSKGEKGAILLIDDPEIYTKETTIKVHTRLKNKGFNPVIPIFYLDRQKYLKKGEKSSSKFITLSSVENHFSKNRELYYYQPPTSLEEAIHIVELEKIGINPEKAIYEILSKEIVKYPSAIEIQNNKLVRANTINPDYQQLPPFIK
jgi:hypothetical protein